MFSFFTLLLSFSFFVKIRENTRWNIANVTQILKISHYFDTFQYFQLFYENFQKITKPDFIYETLRISHNIPYIFSFSKSWSFAFFFKLGKFVQHLANVNQTWRSKIFTYEHFYSRIFKIQLKTQKILKFQVKLSKIWYTISYIKNPKIFREDDLRPKKIESANPCKNELYSSALRRSSNSSNSGS